MTQVCAEGTALFELICRPFGYAFMQRAALMALMLGIVAGVVGAFVVVRGMAFFADALSHAVVPGVAVAYLSGGVHGPLALGAMLAGVGAALLIGFFTRGGRIREDIAIGIVLTASVALGLAILSAARKGSGGIEELLLGNILGIQNGDLVLLLVVGGVLLIVVRLFYKELVITSFDPVLGSTLRYPVEGFRYLLLIMLAATAVLAIQFVGAILITAMLVTPAATAYLLTKRMARLMFVSAAICAGSSVFGLWIAYHLRLPTSAAIVLTMTALFILAYLFAPGRGIVWSVVRARAAHADQ